MLRWNNLSALLGDLYDFVNLCTCSKQTKSHQKERAILSAAVTRLETMTVAYKHSKLRVANDDVGKEKNVIIKNVCIHNIHNTYII